MNDTSSIALRYGLNPHQGPAALTRRRSVPVERPDGQPSYINVLDALTGWQLVRELRTVLGKPAAASYKHVSPAGAVVAGEMSAAAP